MLTKAIPRKSFSLYYKRLIINNRVIGFLREKLSIPLYNTNPT
jgi:hypothetical protein